MQLFQCCHQLETMMTSLARSRQATARSQVTGALGAQLLLYACTKRSHARLVAVRLATHNVRRMYRQHHRCRSLQCNVLCNDGSVCSGASATCVYRIWICTVTWTSCRFGFVLYMYIHVICLAQCIVSAVGHRLGTVDALDAAVFMVFAKSCVVLNLKGPCYAGVAQLYMQFVCVCLICFSKYMYVSVH